MRIVDGRKELTPVKFEDLEEGQCFRWKLNSTDVLMKTDYDQDAVSLIDGEYHSDACGEDVFPVDAEVHIIG